MTSPPSDRYQSDLEFALKLDRELNGVNSISLAASPPTSSASQLIPTAWSTTGAPITQTTRHSSYSSSLPQTSPSTSPS
eukprot:CAMPEP_0174240522 /NCGR_PEP_ID=MMETSP0417-20130205/19204_1 /TAXON_ID=242541 /ORGANISM="Mayorella sp, Strain BSH-02190019" /LENGTH=78 /DNA_ID=CAMNT_0015319619 /DNA_START=58 /DNA_END=290 /DNA_ORIENTATION=-